MNKLTIIGIILFLFLVYSLAIYHLGKSKAVKEIIDNSRIDTAKVGKPVLNDSIPYKPQIEYKDKYVNIDSIYLAAKKYWEKIYENSQSVDYIARLDSTFIQKDGKDTIAKVDVSFYSRIPIDPLGYYKAKLNIWQKTITKTIPIETYSGARYFIQLGMRMNLTDEIKPIYEAGAGLYMVNNSFLEIPISLNAEYLEKLNWNLQANLRAKF